MVVWFGATGDFLSFHLTLVPAGEMAPCSLCSKIFVCSVTQLIDGATLDGFYFCFTLNLLKAKLLPYSGWFDVFFSHFNPAHAYFPPLLSNLKLKTSNFIFFNSLLKGISLGSKLSGCTRYNQTMWISVSLTQQQRLNCYLKWQFKWVTGSPGSLCISFLKSPLTTVNNQRWLITFYHSS